MTTKTTVKASKKATKKATSTKAVATQAKPEIAANAAANLFANAHAQQKQANVAKTIASKFATAHAQQRTASATQTVATVTKVAKTSATKVTKDLTKRDVVVVRSAALQQAYICTTLKYSAVSNAQQLLVADMLKRATLVELATATDLTFEILSAQVCVTLAQQTKYAQHCNYVNAGYKMLSTKGKNVTVVATA